jgi:hypothetical protein
MRRACGKTVAGKLTGSGIQPLMRRLDSARVANGADASADQFNMLSGTLIVVGSVTGVGTGNGPVFGACLTGGLPGIPTQTFQPLPAAYS